MKYINRTVFAVILASLVLFTGCQHLAIDSEKLLKPSADLSEIVGIIAGFGTTFAAFPDLMAMLRRPSSEGMNPRMSTIMGAFPFSGCITDC